MEKFPSIFNDVIGPVMRGPSSSHCAASLRIGRMCRDLMSGNIRRVLIEFDPNGSLATTHKGQGSDMGLFGGFLGWEADDERLPDYEQAVQAAGIEIRIDILPIGAQHPNTYQITLWNESEQHSLIALSTGGGMIEVIAIDSAPVQMDGDFFETLVYLKEKEKEEERVDVRQQLSQATMDLFAELSAMDEFDEINLHQGAGNFIEIKSQKPLSDKFLELMGSDARVESLRVIEPVLPVLSRKGLSVPFITVEKMLQYNQGKNLKLWELALHYESIRGGISQEDVFEKMRRIIRIMRQAIETGIRGTNWQDRILGPQSVGFKQEMENGTLVSGDVINTIILFTSAIMEVKSSMGVIVAAPTAGSCGALPGAVIGTASVLNLSEDDMVKAMLAAGLIGVFIAAHATFAAEVGGCMAECGSGCGMAAAGIVVLKDGSLEQSLAAASMALQTSLGMVCDTIADRVEAPCLNRNVMAASNALSCANMSLANYNHLIPLDEVIETMKKVGDAIPHTLRCTGLGGLAITKTAKEIEARLNNNMVPVGTASGYKVC
ncbi:MAG: L-serine ammonia-lyase, iron-sulfur-dependent, subunit alpha [Cyclobacteriaceae bacterium]